MNTLPRLLMNPSWETIHNLSWGELCELGGFALLSLGFVAALAYGVYLWLFPRKPAADE